MLVVDGRKLLFVRNEDNGEHPNLAGELDKDLTGHTIPDIAAAIIKA